MNLRPFEFDVHASELEDLRGRLARTRWPDAVEGVGRDHGTDPAYLKTLCRTWEREFDWRQKQRELNRCTTSAWP